jgi:hypothetical protein
VCAPLVKKGLPQGSLFDRAGDRHLREICHRSSLTFDFDLLYGAILVGRFDEIGAYKCNLEAK